MSAIVVDGCNFRLKYWFWLLLLMLALAGNGPAAEVPRKITLPYDSSVAFPLTNLEYHSPKELKIAVVLSGGGARGFAHIGVLKALEENNIPVHLMVGSSMGSIFGGLYAAGYSSSDLLKIVKEINWQSLFTDETYRTNLFWSQKTNPRRHILEVRFENGMPYIPSSISPGQKIFDTIYSRLLRANFQAANNFDNLQIPFRAVATDLISGDRVVLKKGDLAEAITASSAVPLLFAPVRWDGMWLVDGGIRDNLPVDVAIENQADVTIAVDVTSPLRTPQQMSLPWQMADQVTTIMMREPTREKRQMADVVIDPDIGGHGAGDFTQIDSLVEKGYQATLQKLDSIRNLIRLRQENLWGENHYLGKVREVTVTGLKNSGLDSLMKEMITRAGSSLYYYDLYRDLQRFYQTGLLSDARVLLEGPPEAYRVEFSLKENPVIRQLVFRHHGLLPDSLLYSEINFSSGRVLNFKTLFAGLDTVIAGFVRKGFSLARISDIRYLKSSQKLIVRIDEGLIENLKVKGTGATRDYIITREFPIKKGDIFKADEAIQGIRNIYSTGLFDRVTLNVFRTDTANTMFIKVLEKKYFIMRLGGNASLERKGKVFLEFAEDNFLGREIKASLAGAISDLDREAEFKIYSVRLFNTLLTYRLSFYYRERTDRFYRDFKLSGDYLTIRRGGRFVLGQQIERLGSISAELRLDGVNIFSGDPAFPYRDSYRIRSLTIRSTVDKRDKLPFPTRGIYNRWFWESGNQRLLGSSEAFTRFYLALEGYYPLLKNMVFHVQGEGGSADLTLPFSEFFTLGGIKNFPGLYQREIFGRQMLHLQSELRYNFHNLLPFDFHVGLNYNIGTAWETSEEVIKSSDFLTGWGAYLAVNSLFGPIRLAYGRLMDHRDRLYFSIGYEF